MYIIFNEDLKFVEKSMEDGRVELKRKMFSCGENIVSYLAGRCMITITIFDSNDVTQSNTYKMHRWIQTYYFRLTAE